MNEKPYKSRLCEERSTPIVGVLLVVLVNIISSLMYK
jgi:hypothetical protein